MADAFIAVDLGAQSGRVMLGIFDHEVFTLEQVHRFTNTPHELDGTLCWNVENLFNETINGIGRAVHRAQEHDAELRGIGVDSWGVDYGLIDARGALTAPVRHYRAADAGTMDAAAHLLPPDVAYERTGIIESPINTCFQLFRDARLGLLTSHPTMLLIPDLWTFWLCGATGVERTIASTTGLVDQRTGDWSTESLTALDIPIDVLPPLVASGTLAGVTTPAITERIGATTPIPVFRAPGHDTACAFAAVTDAHSGRAVISCGTWALVGCATTAPVLSAEARTTGFTNEEGVDGSITFIRNLSGTWLLEECLRTWSTASDEPVADLRMRLLQDASAIDPARLHGHLDVGATDLLEPGRMPERITRMYREVTGDPTELMPAEIVRLIIESLAHAFAQAIADASRLTGDTCTEVHIIGGGSQIDLLVEQTAQATGLPIMVGHPEATSIGNICVQAVASGMMPTIADARRIAIGSLKGS